MDKNELLNFIEAELAKYDEQANKAMGGDLSTFMHLTGISSGLWLVKSFIEVNTND